MSDASLEPFRTTNYTAITADVFDSDGTLSVMGNGWDLLFLKKVDQSNRDDMPVDDRPSADVLAAQQEIQQHLCYVIGALVQPGLIGGESIDAAVRMADNLITSIKRSMDDVNERIADLVELRASLPA